MSRTILQLLNKAYATEQLFFTESFLNRSEYIRDIIGKRRSMNFRIVKNYIRHALKNNGKINFSIDELSPYMFRRWNLKKYNKECSCYADYKKVLN